MSLKTLLPAPSLPVENRQKPSRPEIRTVAAAGPPPYGAREGWAPRVPADFGDGGAFPGAQLVADLIYTFIIYIIFILLILIFYYRS